MAKTSVGLLSCLVVSFLHLAELASPARVVRMYLDVSLSIVLVDGVDGSLCGSNGEIFLQRALGAWTNLPLDRVGLLSCIQLVTITTPTTAPQSWVSSTPTTDRTASSSTTRVVTSTSVVSTTRTADTTRAVERTTAGAPSPWVKPVTMTCPTLARGKALDEVLQGTEDEANRYCVSVCGVGSWCKCNVAVGQPKICQHGLLAQCGYRLCDCSHLCGEHGGRRLLEQPKPLRYEGSVQFQVEDLNEAQAVLDVIRYNLSGLDSEINLLTEGGLMNPAKVPVIEVLDPSKPLTMNPDFLTTITATIYLEVLPQWRPSIMEAPLLVAVKTFFRTRLVDPEVAIRLSVEIKVEVNNTTPRLMTEMLVDQESFLRAVRLALGPGVSVGHSMPSLLEFGADSSNEHSPFPEGNTAMKKSTFTILLCVILTASTLGTAVGCCVIFKIVKEYRRTGMPRDFELGKAGEIASSRADEDTAFTSISCGAMPSRSITMSDGSFEDHIQAAPSSFTAYH